VTTGSRVFAFAGGAVCSFDEPAPTIVTVAPTIDPAINTTHRFRMAGPAFSACP
jgi:hypothetical protein